MSDRYYIYCNKIGDQLVPFAHVDYDGLTSERATDDDEPWKPDYDPYETDIVVKTFKDNSDLFDPLLEAMMMDDWDLIADWAETLDTAQVVKRTPCPHCGRFESFDLTAIW